MKNTTNLIKEKQYHCSIIDGLIYFAKKTMEI